MRTRLFILVALIALSGCASIEPSPPSVAVGPTATIDEHGINESRSKGQIFYIEAIDGTPVRSSLHATRRKTQGMGSAHSIAHVTHTVPVKPLRLKVVGTHLTGAPIDELISRAEKTFFSVQGELVFLPEPGGEYVVYGKLDKGGSSVWIADVKTEKRVSEIVTSKK